MLQFLINDILPDYNLPSLSFYDNSSWELDIVTPEIRSLQSKNLYLSKANGVVALNRTSKGLLRMLYGDLTYTVGSNTWRYTLTCEEAVRVYLIGV